MAVRTVTTSDSFTEADVTTYDAIVIGAGPTGIQALWNLRQEGLNAHLLEAGSGPGGVWYWNRYPGARLDSESFTYALRFDESMLRDWQWSEYFVGQPELERYFNFVVDRAGLREFMQFDSRVTSGSFDESTSYWELVTEDGTRFRSRLVFAATGILSIPNFPNFPGRDGFRGEIYHTGKWPKDGVSFSGKRVAVIGTGASGTQIIPHVAREAQNLTVFQRTPNWAVPLRNKPISAEEMESIRSRYAEIFKITESTYSGFLHDWDPTDSTSLTTAERREYFEERWQRAGFAKWFGLYRDIMVNPDVNREYCDFVAEKIRERVEDVAIADKLIPDDHLFGTKRVPAETDYFEAYNEPHVTLVDLREEPIIEITAAGIRTSVSEQAFDTIVFATGFDAFSGALMNMDLRGIGGVSLRDEWANGPKTYLGIQVAGFPNLFVLGGPHGKGGIGNGPRAIEPVHEFALGVIRTMRREGIVQWEAEPAAQEEWTSKVLKDGNASLGAKTKSFMFGDNVEGKPRVYLVYVGSLPEFAQRLTSLAQDGYPGFRKSRAGQAFQH